MPGIPPRMPKQPAVEVDADARARSAVADAHQALCSFLREAGVSHKTLPALAAAVGAAGARPPRAFFRLTDRDLGSRVGAYGAGEQAYARRWSRAWRLVDSEQRRTGLTLVERRRGGRPKASGRAEASEYRVPLAQIVLNVVRRAGRLKGGGLRRADRFDLAAREVAALLPRDYGARLPSKTVP